MLQLKQPTALRGHMHTECSTVRNKNTYRLLPVEQARIEKKWIQVKYNCHFWYFGASDFD